MKLFGSPRKTATRLGLVFVLLDLGAAAAFAGHVVGQQHGSGASMSSGRLEQLIQRRHGATSCSADRNGGWDYYCVSSDGSKTLYDVSGGRIARSSDLPSYR